MRRGRLDLAHHAHDLVQLAHQLGAILQTAGGIDQHHLRTVGLRRGDRLERQARRIGTGLRAPSPSRRCARPRFSIARWRRRGTCRRRPASPCLPSARSLAASLPMVVVLPEPLTPDTRMTNGVARDFERLCHRRQHLLDFGRQAAPALRPARCPSRSGLRAAPSAMRVATAGPRSARISSFSSSSSVSASSLRLMTRSLMAPPSEAEVALEPGTQALPPAGFLGAVVHVGARDTRFGNDW